MSCVDVRPRPYGFAVQASTYGAVRNVNGALHCSHSRCRIRSMGHRYWLSAVSLLRYVTSVVPKISISVRHCFKFPKFSRFSRRAANPVLYLAAVCCWKHRWPSHRRVSTPCGRSRRRDWCRSENGECGLTRPNRSWRTSLQDLSRMYAAEGWQCTGWNHRVPVAAAETSNKK